MTTYEELKKEFEKRVAELQSECKHEKTSGWMPQAWAPAHYSRFQVNICEVCHKVVGKRTTCDGCGKIIDVSNLKRPPLKDYTDVLSDVELLSMPPWDTYWCEDCYANRCEMWNKKKRMKKKLDK